MLYNLKENEQKKEKMKTENSPAEEQSLYRGSEKRGEGESKWHPQLSLESISK